MGEQTWAFNKKNTSVPRATGEDIIRRRTLSSIMALNSDDELNAYLMETVKQIANSYSKELNDFSPKDIKRCVDQVYGLIEKMNAQDVSFKKFEAFKNHIHVGGELSTLFTFSKAVAGLSNGNIGYLVWHISKEVSKPRIKRAIVVYICALLANSLYGGTVKEIEFKESLLDPIFEAMDREMLELVANQLKITSLKDKTDENLLKEITKNIISDGKEQSIARSWFPKDAESYLEVLVVVAKKVGVNIKGLSSVEEIETAICVNVFSEIWIKLPEDKKIQLAAELKAGGSKISPEYIFSMAGFGAIGIANLGGFSTYLAGSMSLSFLASSLGFSIPFAGYTALSSTLFVAIGPVGAVAATLPTVFEWLRAKPEKLVSVIITVAICRAKLIAEGKLIDAEEKRKTEKRRKFFKIYVAVGTLMSLLALVGLFILR